VLIFVDNFNIVVYRGEDMNENILKSAGNTIRVLRKQKGFSQEALAERAGLHPNYIGAIERAEKNPTILSLAAITSSLDVSLEEFFSIVELSNRSKKNPYLQIIELFDELDEKGKAHFLKIAREIKGIIEEK
jgi:transcriptional regulator with XRE-family HTH domain